MQADNIVPQIHGRKLNVGKRVIIIIFYYYLFKWRWSVPLRKNS